jgi:hypothetical protein
MILPMNILCFCCYVLEWQQAHFPQGDVTMPRISIDVTDQQHQRLKAFAALRGQSIKDYVHSIGICIFPFPEVPMTQ